MRPLVKYWRSRGLYCIVYLDDGLIMDSTLEKTERASHLVYRDLVASGFVITRKEHLVPSTVNCLAGYCLEF